MAESGQVGFRVFTFGIMNTSVLPCPLLGFGLCAQQIWRVHFPKSEHSNLSVSIIRFDKVHTPVFPCAIFQNTHGKTGVFIIQNLPNERSKIPARILGIMITSVLPWSFAKRKWTRQICRGHKPKPRSGHGKTDVSIIPKVNTLNPTWPLSAMHMCPRSSEALHFSNSREVDVSNLMCAFNFF